LSNKAGGKNDVGEKSSGAKKGCCKKSLFRFDEEVHDHKFKRLIHRKSADSRKLRHLNHPMCSGQTASDAKVRISAKENLKQS
jgi:hypothetical protein